MTGIKGSKSFFLKKRGVNGSTLLQKSFVSELRKRGDQWELGEEGIVNLELS